jgi:hypothetical protein
MMACAAPALAKADPPKVVVTADVSGGYARLVFTLGGDVDGSVHSAGNVLIISFDKPILISVDRLSAQAPEYIGAARRDPDGRAIRIGLARKVSVNSIAAGDKFFVDLLPDTWTGPPPSLPQDVVEELARRAREAERLERLAHQAEQQNKLVPVPVHVGDQPTFTRYVFDVPDKTSVSADRGRDRLTLSFDVPLAFDLSDVEAALPATVASIHAEAEQDSTLVRFSFLTAVDLRTFRDGKGYVVDIVKNDTASPAREKAAANPLPMIGLETGPSATPAGESLTPGAAVMPPSDSEKPAIAQPATTATQNPPVAATAAPTAEPPATPQASEPPVAPKAPEAKALEAKPSIQAAPAAAVQPAAPSAPSGPASPAAAATPAGAPNPDAPPVAAKAVPAASLPPPSVTSPAAPTARPPRESKIGDTVAIEMSRQGANLKLAFPFPTPTAAAVFHRADTLWIVFDATSAIDLAALVGEASRTIRGAEFSRDGDAGIVRLRLDHPHLTSIASEGAGWSVTIGDAVAEPTRALDITRNLIGPTRASVTVSFDGPHRLHRIRDPEVDDDLLVVTGFAPARGFIKEQDFVEFHALASTQGVVIEPLSDDLHVELSADKIVIGRPGGLTLSSSLQSVLHGSALRPVMFDAQVWGLDRQSIYGERQSQLIAAAAAAPAAKRLQQRLDLARFYIARDMYPEAKGVLDVVLGEGRPAGEDVTASVLRAAAEVMMNRPDAALKDLANPAIGDQHDAPLWRALAYAGQGKWGLARDSFKRVEAAVATMPVELQRVALKSEMRTAIEVGDFAGAADELNDLETIGLPHELQPAVSVLVGRLSEGMGRNEDALAAYRTAADSWDRPAAAQGRLREAALRYTLGDLKREDVVSELEALTTIWRGDETEVGALEIMARLYTEEGRYRDSFYVMRSAVAAHPAATVVTRTRQPHADVISFCLPDGPTNSPSPVRVCRKALCLP